MEEGDVVINRKDKKRKLEYFTLNTLKKCFLNKIQRTIKSEFSHSNELQFRDSIQENLLLTHQTFFDEKKIFSFKTFTT